MAEKPTTETRPEFADGLYIVGGQQRSAAHFRKEWQSYQKGLILRVDPKTLASEVCVEYVSPPEARADDRNFQTLFKAATILDGKLYACTTTEILEFQLPSFERIGYVSLPCFNDVHHVAPMRHGNLLVANTGLDMVLELSRGGNVLREWSVLGESVWERFSKDVDYRKIVSTKPHHSHPNYVFQTGADIWSTRFNQRDAICLTRPDRRIEIGVQGPHDGILHNGSIYFTTVDGHIVIVDVESREIRRVIGLNTISNPDIALGWCRGLHIVNDRYVVVGFTRLRPTAILENLHWIKHRFGMSKAMGIRPTRIALYDLAKEELCWEFDLEPFGMNAIFSIHDATTQEHGLR